MFRPRPKIALEIGMKFFYDVFDLIFTLDFVCC